jgi:hypothetical protein
VEHGPIANHEKGLERICYLLKQPVEQLGKLSWHFEIVVVNIEHDIKVGCVAIGQETYEEYVRHRELIRKYKEKEEGLYEKMMRV